MPLDHLFKCSTWTLDLSMIESTRQKKIKVKKLAFKFCACILEYRPLYVHLTSNHMMNASSPFLFFCSRECKWEVKMGEA